VAEIRAGISASISALSTFLRQPAGRKSGAAGWRRLGPQCVPQNAPDRLRPRWPRLRLLRDPGVQRRLDVRVEPQANLGPNSGARPAALVFLTLSYCARPRLVVPRTYHRPGARRLPRPGSDHRTPWLRRRRMAAGQLNRSWGGWLGAAKPRLVPGSSPGQARVRAVTVRAPRRPACADSVLCSRSRCDRSAALGRLG
jgi:hypothetical protein